MLLYAPQLMPVTNLPIISNSGDAANWQKTHSSAPIYAGIQLIRTAFFLQSTTDINSHLQPSAGHFISSSITKVTSEVDIIANVPLMHYHFPHIGTDLC